MLEERDQTIDHGYENMQLLQVFVRVNNDLDTFRDHYSGFQEGSIQLPVGETTGEFFRVHELLEDMRALGHPEEDFMELLDVSLSGSQFTLYDRESLRDGSVSSEELNISMALWIPQESL